MRAPAPAPLRALVIGAGYMGRRHLDAYRICPDTITVGAVARTAATRERIAAAYDTPVFDAVERALAETRPSVVSVCTPTALHAAHATAALEAGAHVLVEKPLTVGLEEGRRLVALARARDRLVVPAHTTLFEPPTWALVRLVQGRALGALRTIRWERRGLDVSPGEVEKGRGPGADGARDGEGEDRGWLYDHLVHVTYVLNRLAGAVPQDVAVAVRAARRFGETLRARVTYRNGVVADLDLTSDPRDPFSKQLTLEGDLATAEWQMTAGSSQVRLRPRGAAWQPLPFAGGSAFDATVLHFVEAVRAGRRPLESGEDGLRAMALAAALAGGWPLPEGAGAIA